MYTESRDSSDKQSAGSPEPLLQSDEVIPAAGNLRSFPVWLVASAGARLVCSILLSFNTCAVLRTRVLVIYCRGLQIPYIVYAENYFGLL